MKKNELVFQIRRIYVSLIEFKNAVQKINLGLEIERNKVHLSQTDCDFGIWFYQEGQYLNNLKSFQYLEKKHNKIHRIFQTIYKMSLSEFTREETVFLISNADKLKNKDKRLLDAYCKDFIKESDKLSNGVKKLYNEIVLMPDTYFKSDILLTN
jgi:hypothetical protein